MSLLTQSDLENGENFNGQLLHRKVRQAMRNAATQIEAESPTTDARQAFAALALSRPLEAMQPLIPYVVQNPTIQQLGGEATDNDIIFVLTDPATGVINALYPLD